jgi:hypothetical protein
MRSRLFLLVALLLPAICSVQAASALAAKKPSPGAIRGLVVSPKKPKANQTITVSFTSGRLSRDRRYDVSLRVADAAGCSGGFSIRLTGVVPPGVQGVLRFSPRDRRAVGMNRTVPGRFCAGSAGVTVGHAGADGRVVVLARKRLDIAPAGGPETYGTPARLEVLDGSMISVKAPGRPDRSNALSGLIRGYMAGPLRPERDISIGALSGGLWVRSLQVDQVCAGAPVLTDYPAMGDDASKLLLAASGEAKLTLALRADPISLAGCAGGAAATTLTLTGRVTPDGLAKLPLTGSIEGVTIAPGVTATVAISLLLNVDLSGKP